MQMYFLYKQKYNTAITNFLTQEFEMNNTYYHYIYYPLQILSKLLYSFLIVFTQDYKYTVPIVISITDLILCNFYTVSYIISMKPYLLVHNTLLTLALISVEIMYLFIPLTYSMSGEYEWVVDSLLLVLFSIGIFIGVLRGYLDFKGKTTVVPIINREEENVPNKVGSHEALDSSLDNLCPIKEQNSENSMSISKIESSVRENRTRVFSFKENKEVTVDAESDGQNSVKKSYFSRIRFKSQKNEPPKMKKLNLEEIGSDFEFKNSKQREDFEYVESPASYMRGLESAMRVNTEISQLSNKNSGKSIPKTFQDLDDLTDEIESRNQGVKFPLSPRSLRSPMSHQSNGLNINAMTVKKFDPIPK